MNMPKNENFNLIYLKFYKYSFLVSILIIKMAYL
jgi:hypothetical protein